jgi:hypothetical protein
MAQIDPSIALQFRQPQIQDPVNQFAKAQELSVNALKMQEMQRGLQEEEQIRNYLAGADLTKPETRAGLAKFGKAGLATGKLLAEQEKAGLESRKLGLDVNEKTLNAHRERVSDLAFNPSDTNIKAHLEDSLLRKEITPEQANQQLNRFLNMPVEQRKQEFLQMGVNASKRLEQMTISAAQQQTADVTRRGQDISAATTRRGQDMQADPQLQSTIAQAKEYGQNLGKNRALAEAALPGAIQTADESIRLIDEMVGKAPVKDKSGKVIEKGTAPHPGFKNYVGAALVPGMRFVEGSDTASFDIRQKQIEGKAFLEAFNALKGGGSITEKEGEKGTQAIMRMNKASSEREYVAAARELQDIMRKGVERAKTKAGGGASAAPSGGGNVIDFNSLN